MSRKCKVIDSHESKKELPSSCSVTEWNLCAICQEEKVEKLVNPAIDKFRSMERESGYKMFADIVYEFQEKDCLPENYDFERLDNGEGLESTLTKNNAVWHKSCRNKLDKQKLQRALKRKQKEMICQTSPVKTRKTIGTFNRSDNCFFCNKDSANEKLHNIQTDSMDSNIRKYAQLLQDKKLLGKLSEGDMHALDAKYHLNCLTISRNRVRKSLSYNNTKERTITDSIVLGELVSYIEEFQQDDEMPVFHLSELGKLYQTRLREIDSTCTGRINTTRLKERLLSMIPDFKAQQQGREVILMFDSDIGEAIKIACSQSADADIIHLVRTAQILRKDILDREYLFDVSFESNCEVQAVPESVLLLEWFLEDLVYLIKKNLLKWRLKLLFLCQN